jgi:hypothetical protein
VSMVLFSCTFPASTKSKLKSGKREVGMSPSRSAPARLAPPPVPPVLPCRSPPLAPSVRPAATRRLPFTSLSNCLPLPPSKVPPFVTRVTRPLAPHGKVSRMTTWSL